MTAVPWRFATLVHALTQQAKDRPDSLAVRFVAPGGGSLADSDVSEVTFAELHRRAASIAAVLVECAEPGDRALLLCAPGLEYVAALFGCFYAGVVAVPAYPPVNSAGDERLTRLIGDCSPSATLTVKAIADFSQALCRQVGSVDPDPHMVLLDASELGDRPAGTTPELLSDLAFLQYTSGSTGDPRGVMLTHANLLANVCSIASHLELADDARGVFWLPPYHDMGLIGGILTSVVLGGETTLMSPMSFLATPLLWLEAVSRYRGTFSAAPNFAYDLCVRKITEHQAAALDLSSWKSVVNGAEPVRQETMDRFAAHFAPGGFRRSAFMPAYGLAEATLLVSAARLGVRRGSSPPGAPSDNGAAGDPSSPTGPLVSVGVPDDGARLLIVDPETRRALPDGEVGEIWFSSPTVGVGYWGSPQKSEATFAATLAEDPDGPRFLRTGDLGVLRDGELYISGRIKDLIIVRGQNYHTHDVELAASEAESALRPGCLAAFGVDGEQGQRLVLVAELARALEDDDAGEALFGRVRARIGRDVGLALDELVLIERGASLKTSSGKIRRAATRAAYVEDALRVVARCRWSGTPGGAPSDADGAAGTGADEGSSDRASAKRALGARRLAELPAREREAILRERVLTHLTALLGDVPADAITAGRTFKELGLESPGAVDLSARLGTENALDLSPTLCFEHSSPAALASYLSARLAGETPRRVARPRAPATDEPVAIVGMACRFPGGVDSPESLWALLSRGADAISEFPRDRGWDLARLFDADPERPGTSHAREGGFLQDAAAFDAGFFGIGPRQADAIDPQQRLILEVAWQALEDAGIDPTALAGSATSVFAGVSSLDHAIRLGSIRSRELEAHLLTGAAASAVSGRVAYALGLSGAAVTVDTACSSSLVALHEASRALAGGECSLALAGGVTVLSTPAVFTGFSRQGALAPDGRCKPFAAAADGTSFSEGAGLLVLERLADARERGHRVLALVRGSAVNQDGRSNGFTAPNPNAQEEVIRAALAAADLAPDDIDAVEAHGTGTALGDPIEAQALIAAYGPGRTRPLWLGSLKSNLGHTQAAAGVAGVMKMVMAMRHERLPKTLHVDEPSPHVDWSSGAVSLLSSAREWQRGRRPRRAGVSSFGISGTNAHVVLEEAPPCAEEVRPAPAPVLVWALSAKSEPALRRQAQRLRVHLERHPEVSALDVAYTLATGRARMEHRAAILGSDREALVAGLDALVENEFRGTVFSGRIRKDNAVAFVFGGQGAQWHGMARELMDSSATFAESLRACEAALSPHVDWSLEDVLRGADEAALRRVDVVQPALWAVMVSVAGLWRSFGVHPAIVVGHSQGEIAAAQVAGGLSLQDAARLVARRGRALRELEGAGDMISLGVGAQEAERLIAGFGEGISLAAENGPRATVVSGDTRALEELLVTCEAERVSARRIAVGFASHSRQVEAIREPFLRSLVSLRPRSGHLPFLSSLAAEVIDTAGLDGEYWYRSLREPVRFAQATRALMRKGCSALIEMSPHPVLAMPMQETIDEAAAGDEVVVIASQRRGSSDLQTFLSALGEAFVHGVDVDWRPLFDGRGARLVALPTYPFERERHWLMPEPADAGAAVGVGPEHPLLDTSVRLAERDAWLLGGRISLHTHPWLAEHRVLEAALLPASAFLDLALHAGSKVDCEEVQELTLQAPLVLPEEGVTELQVSVGEPDEDGRRALLIASRPLPARDDEDNEWCHHARGALTPAAPVADADVTNDPWPPPAAEPIELGYLEDRLAELGISSGHAFRRLGAAWRLGNEVFVEPALEDGDADASFGIGPALVDAMIVAASAQIGASERGRVLMPFAWSGVRARAASSARLRARIGVVGDSLAIDVTDEDGRQVLSVKEVVMRPLETAQLRSVGLSDRELLLGLDWVDVSAPGQAGEWAGVGVLGDAEVGAVSPPRYADVEAVADAAGSGASLRALLVGVNAQEQTPAGVRDAAARTLSFLQTWLGDERLRALRLVLITRNAVAAREGEAPNLAGAAVWGLVRSAQSEHPGHLLLADVDGTSASWAVLPGALALEEPQLALRDGAMLVPRLSPREPSQDGVGPSMLDPSGTVLITGATGQLGAFIALHLARKHGMRHLLLCSRTGPAADGAAELQSELARLGCEVRIAQCDVSDRAALARLLASIPAGQGLTAVVHAAGTLDDGLLESLDRARLDRVMAAKVDAAIALDELTAEIPLSAFVLLSSAVATLGGAGQANYAAANAVLDAVAQARRARGLVGQSLAFGLWQRDLGAEHAERADALAQLESQVRARLGMLALEPERGLALFDSALVADEAFFVPMRVDMAVLRGNAQVGAISPVLGGLVPHPRRRRDSTAAVRRRLLAAPRAEREALALSLVSDETVSVLGCERSEVTGERTLVELGGESIDALELRNRLQARTGVRLATRVFFGESLRALAASLLEAIEGEMVQRRPSPERLGTLRSLFAEAQKSGRDSEFVSTLIELTRLRSPCDRVTELPPATVLNTTGHAPSLICIPSFMVGSGPHQFARLARSFEGRRTLSALPLPGWRTDEPAPASWDLTIEALCEATLASAGLEDYVLVGYSSGGVLAHAVAERCEAHGAGPAGVVMIDTYAAREGRVFAPMLGAIIERVREYLEVGDDDLIAMGTFLGLAAEWRPGLVSAPALYLRAARPLAALPDADALSAPFREHQTLVSLDADHFTIIEEEAPASASAIDAWLGQIAARQNGNGGRPTLIASGGSDVRKPVV